MPNSVHVERRHFVLLQQVKVRRMERLVVEGPEVAGVDLGTIAYSNNLLLRPGQ